MEQYLSLSARKLLSDPKAVPIIGFSVLLVSFALVYVWIQIFFLFAIELPANGIGLSNICSWQYSFSNDFVWSGSSNTPFLVLVHSTALFFIFRLWKRKQPSILPLEFGLLNILFILVGIGVFILIAIINIVILVIPGAATWINNLVGCEPTFLALPGIVTTPLMAIGLVYSQATGWLGQKIASTTTVSERDDPGTIGYPKNRSFMLIGGGIVFLLLALILLHSWLVLFFTYAIQLPETGSWACWGTGCEKASWQSALSEYFSFSPWARARPFLIVLHSAVLIAFFRFKDKGARNYLPLEIGSLAILFTLIGTFVFVGTIAAYKMANPPIHTVPPVSVGNDGSTLLVPALPQNSSVTRDDTGFIIMDPEDDLQLIYSKIPWEVDGELRAWSGVIASTIMASGLLLSMISGWLNRLIRRLSPRFQMNFLLLMLVISGIVVFLEFYVFGFYLLE